MPLHEDNAPSNNEQNGVGTKLSKPACMIGPIVQFSSKSIIKVNMDFCAWYFVVLGET